MTIKLIIVSFCLLFSLQAKSDTNTPTSNHTASNRTLLKIPYQDRENLLHVMRNNLNSLAKMIDAMSNDDYQRVQKIAEQMSFNKKKGKGLARRGNPAFTAMGVQFHAVNTIDVMKAAKSKNRKATLQAMFKMVTTCVACHANFKVMEWPNNKTYPRPKPTPLVLPKGYKITH